MRKCSSNFSVLEKSDIIVIQTDSLCEIKKKPKSIHLPIPNKEKRHLYVCKENNII